MASLVAAGCLLAAVLVHRLPQETAGASLKDSVSLEPPLPAPQSEAQSWDSSAEEVAAGSELPPREGERDGVA